MFPSLSDFPELEGKTKAQKQRIREIWNRTILALYLPDPNKMGWMLTGLNQYIPEFSAPRQAALLDDALLWLFMGMGLVPKGTTWENMRPPAVLVNQKVLVKRRQGVYKFSGSVPYAWMPFVLARMLAHENPSLWSDFLVEASLRLAAPILKERFVHGRQLPQEVSDALFADPWISPLLVWSYGAHIPARGCVLNSEGHLINRQGKVVTAQLPRILIACEVIPSEMEHWMEWSLEHPVALPYPQWLNARNGDQKDDESRMMRLLTFEQSAHSTRATHPRVNTYPYRIQWGGNGRDFDPIMIYDEMRKTYVGIEEIPQGEWNALIRKLEEA